MGIGQTAANEKEQQRTGTKPESKEEQWCDPRSRVHRDKPIEFVTKFGGVYLGKVECLARNTNPNDVRPYGENQVFVGESLGPDQYFSPHLIEKWRYTEKRVEKERLLGMTNPDAAVVFGYITPIFINYYQLRQAEKWEIEAAHLDRNRSHNNSIDCTHYTLGKDGKHFWSTQFFGPKSSSTYIIEHEGQSEVEVHFDGVVKIYSFRDVAQAVEDIYNHTNGVKPN